MIGEGIANLSANAGRNASIKRVSHATLEEMRALLSSGEAIQGAITAASAWNGMLIARVVAPDGYTLNREVVRVLSAFRGKPLPRVWSL